MLIRKQTKRAVQKTALLGFDEGDRPQNAGRQRNKVLHVLGDEEHAVSIPQEPIVRQWLPGHFVDRGVADHNA